MLNKIFNDFLFCYNKLYLLDKKNKLAFTDDFILFKPIDINDFEKAEVVYIKNFENELYCYNTSKTCIINNINILNYFDRFIVFKKGGYLIERIIAKGEKILACSFCDINSNHFKQIWKLEYYSTILFLSENLYVLEFEADLKKKKLNYIQLSTGQMLWQYIIPKKYGYTDIMIDNWHDGEIGRIIGEYGNILYISSTTGWLIGLDVETGKEKFSLGKPHKYFEGFDYNYDTNEVFIGNYVMLNAEKGKMYSIIGTWYAEIDLTGTIPFYEIFDIKEDLENCGFKSIAPNFENKFDGKYYIFDEHRLKEFEGAIGIFDMEKRKIVWTSMANLPERPYFKDIKKMELKGNKLYVLEKQGDFYIFEIDLP